MRFLNPETLLENFAGDVDLLKNVTELFKNTQAECIEGLEEAFKEKNVEEVVYHSHRLAGSIANFTKEGPFKIAKEMENSAMAGMELPKIKVHFPTLRTELEELIQELEMLGPELAA